MGKKDSANEDITESENTYDRMPKKYLDKPLHYPNEDKMKIKLTFRMVITGETGSGKTNVCAQIVRKIGCFTKVLLFAKDLEEPIYKYLVDTIKEIEKETGLEVLKSSNDIEDLPEVNKLSKKENTLVIIDDMVNEKSRQLAKVAGYWTKGRHFNASSIFLTQTYFGTPPDIRKNSGYFVFTKLTTNRDFRKIGRDFESAQDEDLMDKMFQIAVRDKGGFPHFLLIDVASNDPKLLFRADFKAIPWTPSDPVSGREAVIGITQELTTNDPAEQKDKANDSNSSKAGGDVMNRVRTDPSSSSLKVDEQESSDEVEDGGAVKGKKKRKRSTKKNASTKKKAKKEPSSGRKGPKLSSKGPTQVVISSAHHPGYTSRVNEGFDPKPLLARRVAIQYQIEQVLAQLTSHMSDAEEPTLRSHLKALQDELLSINHRLASTVGLGLNPPTQRRRVGHGVVHLGDEFYKRQKSERWSPLTTISKARQMVAYMRGTGQIS